MLYFNGNNKAGDYIHMTGRKVGLLRRTGLIKGVRASHGYVYSQDELDRFMKEWAGYDLRNEDEILTAKRMKNNGIAPDKLEA